MRSMSSHATSSSVAWAFCVKSVRIVSSQRGISVFSTCPTITGFVVAPQAPMPMAYSKSALAQESTHMFVWGNISTVFLICSFMEEFLFS